MRGENEGTGRDTVLSHIVFIVVVIVVVLDLLLLLPLQLKPLLKNTRHTVTESTAKQ